MPKYFGFEGAGVLLYDEKKEWFFTEPPAHEESDDENPKPPKDFSSDEEDEVEAPKPVATHPPVEQPPINAAALAAEIKEL
jgi:hypothetical protein